MTATATYELVNIAQPRERIERWGIKVENKIIGFIEKICPRKYETHPWKAFHGVGFRATYKGCAYGKGAKDKAINAVLNNTTLS